MGVVTGALDSWEFQSRVPLKVAAESRGLWTLANRFVWLSSAGSLGCVPKFWAWEAETQASEQMRKLARCASCYRAGFFNSKNHFGLFCI